MAKAAGHCKALRRSGETMVWRSRFFAEEALHATDDCILDDIQGLRFDFRFWTLPLGEDVSPVYRTGLRHSFSHNVVMAPLPDGTEPVPEDVREYMNIHPDWVEGRMLGHPNGDGAPYISWFSDGKSIQWGYVPNLWPKGQIRRTPYWGVEIQNPNVCLRAIDPTDGSNRGQFDDMLRTLQRVRVHVDDGEFVVDLPASYLDTWMSRSEMHIEMIDSTAADAS